MKATIRLPVETGMHVYVKVGDSIDPQTHIIGIEEHPVPYIIPISQFLHVKPGEISKYLKVKPGDTIDMDTVIARKKHILSNFLIKSPVGGVFKDLDLKEGTITIMESAKGKKEKISLPVKGIVKEISRSFVEIEAEGKSYHCREGKGHECMGILQFIDGENIGILDIKDELEGKIIAGKNILAESLVKIEVMGAIGLISANAIFDSPLSWIEVNNDTLDDFRSMSGKKIWLSPQTKQIIVFN